MPLTTSAPARSRALAAENAEALAVSQNLAREPAVSRNVRQRRPYIGNVGGYWGVAPGTGLYCVMKAGDLTLNTVVSNRAVTNGSEEICALWQISWA